MTAGLVVTNRESNGCAAIKLSELDSGEKPSVCGAAFQDRLRPWRVGAAYREASPHGCACSVS